LTQLEIERWEELAVLVAIKHLNLVLIPNSRNNGIIGILNGNGIDITNTKSPSLRDLVKKQMAVMELLCIPLI
jgi:hypothetical protein